MTSNYLKLIETLVETEFGGEVSPRSETSIAKKIPMTFRDHSIIKALTRQGIQVRYRGPRAGTGRMWRNQMQSYCLKKDATTFALYPPRGERWK
jgi:hypothetical protein